MNQSNLTRVELLNKHPKMKHSDDPRPNEGGNIAAEQAVKRILAYEQFINDPTPKNLQGQTIAIGFNKQKLIDWLKGLDMDTAAVQVYLALDEDNKFNVIFWPYNHEHLPTVIQASEGSAGDNLRLADPYNIGGRRP